jgi:hypothetical protein
VGRSGSDCVLEDISICIDLKVDLLAGRMSNWNAVRQTRNLKAVGSTAVSAAKKGQGAGAELQASQSLLLM